MNRIIQGIERFQREIFPLNRTLFERLAAGQSPEALFIACSDSRISLDIITQTAAGDLFVCRNAGNIVPAPGSSSDAVSAAIEYALDALKIHHIVVCGHSDCGAMKGLLHPETLAGMPAVRAWLRHAEGARFALEGKNGALSGQEALTALTKENVHLQLTHLRTHPKVFARMREGTLHLHGWLYQIGTGEVLVLDTETGQWAPFATAPSIDKLRGQAVQEVNHA